MRVGRGSKEGPRNISLPGEISRNRARRLQRPLGALILVLALAIGIGAQDWQKGRLAKTPPISTAEFSRIIKEFSEEGGFFFSDNFISNETSYLHVVDKLRELEASGGAYIGVGPEQNFTYIAKIRPRIAFIVDIRRQAMIEQLMYKAIFHLSEDRSQFLSRLFSKPLPRKGTLRREVSLPELLEYFDQAPDTDKAFAENLATIQRMIDKDFQFPLTSHDRSLLEYVYDAFREENLNIQFRFGGRWARRGFQWGGVPHLTGVDAGKGPSRRVRKLSGSRRGLSICS